jgi:signal transduction histidine kinase
MVASSGLALAAILLATMGASAWWVSSAYRRAFMQVQRTEIQAVGELLSETSKSLLEAGELTSLRRLLADASRKYDLQTCRVILPDGQIVADAHPANIDLLNLPPSWSGNVPSNDANELETYESIMNGYAMSLPGRGHLRLELSKNAIDAPYGTWELLSGGAMVGAFSLLALLWVYRRMRARLTTLGAIREALLAFDRGMMNESALLLSADFGAEAEAWNNLLEQKQELNKQLVEEKAGQMLGARRQGRSDLQGACDALKQGLLLLDDQLNARYINGAAAVLLQTSREQCQEKPVGSFIQDEDVLRMLQEVVKGKIRRWTSIESQFGEEGEHAGVLRFSVRPVRQDDTATHELRTPLTNIRLYVETALDEGEEDATVRANCLNVINQESRRLERIVGDMLSVSEIEAGSIQLRRDDVRFDALFEQLEAEYQAMAREKSITLIFDLPPKLPVLQGDRDKIVLAMHNLLGNALKYTREGGQVKIVVESDDDHLTFQVNDSGIGIGADELDRIFDKFYRATNSREGCETGSGLGLALAREVVNLHGGDLTVESELEKGSTFTMTLPVLAEAA